MMTLLRQANRMRWGTIMIKKESSFDQMDSAIKYYIMVAESSERSEQ